MRPLESVIENYLDDEVKRLGGETRKVVYPGRRGAPDRLVLLNRRHAMVEVKRPGERARPEQLREHEKLRRLGGCDVRVVDTKDAVDALLAELMEK